MHGRTPLLAICGTRPEAVKLDPVIRALTARGFRVILVATAQHADLAPSMFRERGLVPDMTLPLAAAGRPPVQMLAAMLARLAPVLEAYRPQMLLVQGDTTSALAGALAAAYARIPLAHVEAGLRSHDPDEPRPEEMQRRQIAPLADLHFAPTAQAAAHLMAEGVPAAAIHITGNTGIDALFDSCARLAADPALCDALAARFPFADAQGRPLLLATVHRRENQGPRLNEIAAALSRLAQRHGARILLPLHPNPAVRKPLQQLLGDVPGVHLVEPLDHGAIVWLMQKASLLLTDSGGLQEEAPSLGLRTLVLRGATERPEALRAGAAELVLPERTAIEAAALRLLQAPRLAPCHPFGDGQSGPRIAAIIESWLGIRRQPALDAMLTVR